MGKRLGTAPSENRCQRVTYVLRPYMWVLVRFAGLAATDCLLFGFEEALDDLRQHRLDGDRVVGGVRHYCELVCGPQ
jgi:hypothetical protein